MSQNKVLLQPLERLDLVDIQAIQDIRINQEARMTGALITNGFGLLKKWSSLSIDNTNKTIAFGDFTYLSRIKDGDDSTQAVVGKHDSTLDSNGTCSFDTYQGAVQFYYAGLGSLPPTPYDEAFQNDISTYEIYYPLIWCKRTLLDGATDNRRFWSVIDAVETVQAIPTRTIESTDFLVGGADLTVDGDVWCPIARIVKWVVIGGWASLDSTCITPYFVADQLLGNSLITMNQQPIWTSKDTGNTTGGLQQAIEYLKDKIEMLYVDGESDLQSYDRTIVDKPIYSLHDLGQRFITFSTAKKRTLGTVKHIIDTRNPYTQSLNVYASSQQDFLFDVRVDYQMVEDLNTVSSPYNAQNLNISDVAMRAGLSTYVVSVPQSYFGKIFTFTCQSVVAMIDPLAPEYVDVKGFDLLLDSSSDGVNSAFTIKNISYIDISGQTHSVFGFKIRRRDYKNSSFFVDSYNIGMFALDITIG